MSHAIKRRIEDLLDESERQKSCAIPLDKQLQDAMRLLARQEKLTCPYRTLYARPDYWTMLTPREQHLHIMRALQMRHPDWTFYGPSAAVAWNLEVNYSELVHVHLACQMPRHNDELLVWHKMSAPMGPPEEWQKTVKDLSVTSLDRTVVDCLRMLDFKNGLAIADSALRHTRRGRSWLEQLCRANSGFGFRGMRQARLTTQHADGRSENGGESFARATMIELGYEVPDLQVSFLDPLSHKRRRVDYLWTLQDGTLVAGELDGQQKYVDPTMVQDRDVLDVLRQERQRESRLTARTKVMRFTFGDVVHSERFEKILNLYGIPRPREPQSYDVRAPARPRRDKGITRS